MSKLGTVNFKVFDDAQINSYNRNQIKTEIIEKLPDQYAKFETQILPYVKTYLNNDILDNFFKDTLKTPITKIYSSHNFNVKKTVKKAIAFVIPQNTEKIKKILNIINKSNVFTPDDLTNTINHDTDINIEIEIKSTLVESESPFIIALKNYIGNLIKLLKLLKDNEENIKNIYALANNQHIKVGEKSSNHKLLPEKRSFYRFDDTNVTAKQLKNIKENDNRLNQLKNLYHFLNDITLDELKEELILFQHAYNNIEKFINGDDSDSSKYSIKYIEEYINNIKKSQEDLITSLQDINNNLIESLQDNNQNYTKDIFKNKITNDNKQEYENILNLLRDITNNEALLEQINDSKKRIKLYLDHSNNETDVKVIDLVEATRNIGIDKQLKAFNNSQFDTETLLTPFDKATSKLPAYLNNIIIIIIFLIFLNLFVTTYFYFTTSIQATANRSNCGGASLCEAETHRHLFLEDNGNDKARDIYIIIVVIFSIYLLSEIFKSYSEDGIDFTDTNSSYIFFKTIIILCFIASVILIELAKFYFVSYDNDYSTDDHPNNHFLWELKRLDGADKTMSYVILGISCAIFGFVAIYYGYLRFMKQDKYGSNAVPVIYFALFIMLAIILGYDISKVVNPKYKQKDKDKNENDNSKGFESTNFNSKFKAKTAIDIILITFYIICILVFGFGLYHNVFTDINYDITLYIIALSLLAIVLVTLYIFILNSSVDWSRPDNTDNYDRYFEFFRLCLLAPGVFPGLLALMFKSKQNIIKLIVFYYAILFIIYLFYVYFINHNNESGILSLAYFQLYNYDIIDKNEKNKYIKGFEDTNYYKEFNHLNVYFVVALLIILIGIGGLNEDSNLDNIIYGIIVFILASYITGIVYLLYNELFPIQQASFNYKKNLVEINNEISQHIKVEDVEHTIDKNKIRVFKIANDFGEIAKIHERIDSSRTDGTTSKEMHMKNIRDIFSEISPKGSSYEDYRSQSTDQMQYEEYIYLLFSDNTTKAITPTYSASKINNILSNALNLKRYTDKLHNIYKTVLEDPSKQSILILSDDKFRDTYYSSSVYNDTLKNSLQTILDTYIQYFPTKYNSSYDKVIQITEITNVLTLAPKSGGFYDKLKAEKLLDDKLLDELNKIYLQSSNQPAFEQNIKDVITAMVSYLELEYTQGPANESGTPTEYSKINLYNKIIIDIPTNIKNLEDAHNIYNDVPLKIPKTNNIEYVIKKNYKYVTGEEGVIQKYNVLSDTELDCLYYKEVSTATAVENNKKLKESIRYIKNINAAALTITNIATATTAEHTDPDPGIEDKTIYKLNQDIFDHYKSEHTIGEVFITFKDGEIYQNISYNNITPTENEKLIPAFYTIGYDYENYTYKADNHQQMNKDTAYSIPARYYACSYLNYFPNEDGSMSKVKFAKNIKEDNYNPLNTKNTIIDRIAERYNENAKETKIQLAPEKFQFLLVFLVILAIILLMFLFNIIKKYFTGDVYTPQMYVLGILGVFLTIFIFGEVIFARIK